MNALTSVFLQCPLKFITIRDYNDYYRNILIIKDECRESCAKLSDSILVPLIHRSEKTLVVFCSIARWVLWVQNQWVHLYNLLESNVEFIMITLNLTMPENGSIKETLIVARLTKNPNLVFCDQYCYLTFLCSLEDLWWSLGEVITIIEGPNKSCTR